jgi:hypothetical protein
MYELFFLCCIITLDWGFKFWKSRTLFGVILGGGTLLTVLSLQTAIFWGNYSSCKSIGYDRFVQCDHVAAMISACVFAVFMFITLLAQLVIMIFRRDEILGDVALDEGLGYSKVNSLASKDESSLNAPGARLSKSVGRGEEKLQFRIEESSDSIDL